MSWLITKPRRRLPAALLLLLGCASGPGQALAQQPSQAQLDALRSNCRSDYRSYCASVPTGGPAALQCLQQHLADLSPSCRTAVQSAGAPGSAASGAPPHTVPHLTMRQEAHLLRQACGADYSALCSGVRPGGGRALACLVRHESALSPGCKGALAEARGNR